MAHDLNDTLIFIKVVDHGSFTAASAALNLPKATVSRKVRNLEGRLGARLLNRTTRKLSLTEAGAAYYEQSRDVARALDAAEDAVQHLEGTPRGWLRVAAPYAFGVAILSPIMQAFRETYPEVYLDIVLSNDDLDIVSREIDVSIRFGALPDSSMVARRLAVYPSRIYASESYLEHHGVPETPEALMQHRTLVDIRRRRGRRFFWPLKNGQTEQEFEVEPVIVGNDPWPLLAMAEGGQGLMMATPAMTLCCEAPSNIRPVLDAWTGPDEELNALFPGGQNLSPKVRAFVDFLVERMEPLNQACSMDRPVENDAKLCAVT